MNEELPKKLQKILIHEEISQPNKMHLIFGWRARGYYIDYQWTGEELRSRMRVRFSPDGPWTIVKSFEFDVRPKLKWMKEK